VTRSIDFVTADVFTGERFGGNQLAVIPDARGITDAQMLAITREFNYSETTFVLPPSDPHNTRRVRIFTPAREIPFAGHPTVGTAHVLAAIGEILLMGAETPIVFEEGVGPVSVKIRTREGKPVFAQLQAAKLPEIGPKPPSRAKLAKVLSLKPEDLLAGKTAPQAVSCGLPFLIVPVRDREALGRARINLAQWEKTLASYWAPDVFVFSRDPERAGSDVRARMFGPGVNVTEDPATGSACVALAGYLAARDSTRDGTLSWVVEQGFEMGRPSILHTGADKQKGKITALRVGGETVIVSRGTMEI
jgi:trans-2,3-dihydro-3-hydroxyanthranilate isomerase